jgi:hypothetical protein
LYRCGDCSHQWTHVAAPDEVTPVFSGLRTRKHKPTICPGCQAMGAIEPVPKYFTMPGFSKAAQLVNTDAAAKYPFCVVVEGPKDVLRVGTPESKDIPGPAVGALGHKLSQAQKLQIREHWGNGTVVILLDPDARETQASLAAELVGYVKNIVSVGLPDGRDPGDCDHHLLWQLIYRTCEKHGVRII